LSKAAGDDWVTLAILTRVRGIRGELMADGLGSSPERYQRLEEVTLRSPGGQSQQVRVVEHVWDHNGRLIFKFAGIDDRTAAERLEGLEVCIPLRERPPVADGEYYLSDLVGCRVILQSDGSEVGVVQSWQDYGAGPILQVIGKGREEILIPFRQAICVRIDVAGKEIVVDPPQGLLGLNG
jgi:16S rRNA processing protein RimM